MRYEYLKTLWLLRFEKLKKSEEGAAWMYQEILDEYMQNCGVHDEVVDLLSRLVQEERSHAKLADGLIRICHSNHPELGVPFLD